MSKAFTKLKTVIQSVIEYRTKKRLNQHSYRVLSQLDDHYLADIGLIDEDLHLLKNGKLPERFSRDTADEIAGADVRLVSTAPAAAEQAEDVLFDPEQFDKAA